MRGDQRSQQQPSQFTERDNKGYSLCVQEGPRCPPDTRVTRQKIHGGNTEFEAGIIPGRRSMSFSPPPNQGILDLYVEKMNSNVYCTSMYACVQVQARHSHKHNSCVYILVGLVNMWCDFWSGLVFVFPLAHNTGCMCVCVCVCACACGGVCTLSMVCVSVYTSQLPELEVHQRCLTRPRNAASAVQITT